MTTAFLCPFNLVFSIPCHLMLHNVQSASCGCYMIIDTVLICVQARLSKLVPSSIWGPTCDGLDQVVEKTLLPLMSVGDWIIFENMGAYTLPVASPFNGFPVPKVHVVAHESVWYAYWTSTYMCAHTYTYYR
jgi:hypothetical protein